MNAHERFNRTRFSRFINSGAGRAFRLAAGTGFLVAGYLFRDRTLGVVSLIWSVFPLTAGAFDWCYVSAACGGPLAGRTIRAGQDALQ
jgi:hypothetical protein